MPGRRLLVQHAPLGHVLGTRRGIAVANELAMWSVTAAFANAQAGADRGRALPVSRTPTPSRPLGTGLPRATTQRRGICGRRRSWVCTRPATEARSSGNLRDGKSCGVEHGYPARPRRPTAGITEGCPGSVGPRVARAHVGTGGVGLSSGVGPFTASATSSGGRRTRKPGNRQPAPKRPRGTASSRLEGLQAGLELAATLSQMLSLAEKSHQDVKRDRLRIAGAIRRDGVRTRFLPQVAAPPISLPSCT